MTDALSSIGDMTTISTLPSLSSSSLSTPLGTASGIDKAAQDFEAMFATQLLQPMFDTVHVNDTFGGGHGEEVMRSFLLQEYGKMIAKTGRLGIAAPVKAEMLRAQESARENGGGRGRGLSPSKIRGAYANATTQDADYVSH
jgi:Rod binding domain-containing protein